MKLVRWGPPGAERPGLLDKEGRARDLSGLVPNIAGAVLSDVGLAMLRAIDAEALPRVPEGARLGPCVGGVGKIIGIGLNYADHAAETGQEVPREPIVFLKATSALSGAEDPIILPRGSEKLDWEVELAVVIGQRARHVPEEEALAYVAGYAIMNDVSERAFQLEHGGQWSKGKSADGFAPLGPWLVTRDEIPDPHELALELSVNGEVMQRGTTATMVHRVPKLVAYLSRFMTLYPGDVITTGTPPGVGLGKKPPRFLKPGDCVEATIAGLGRQRQVVVEES